MHRGRLAGAVLFSAALCLGELGCQTPSAGGGQGRAYLRALQEQRWGDAYALTSATFRAGVTRPAYEASWADPARRARHVEELWAALDAVDVAAPELLDVAPEVAGLREQARQALQVFLSAVEERRFDAAYALLAAPLRARYTVESFRRDFELEPTATERLARARRAVTGTPQMSGNRVSFRLSSSAAVVLVREVEGFRVLELE